jgi:hypothetical protein
MPVIPRQKNVFFSFFLFFYGFYFSFDGVGACPANRAVMLRNKCVHRRVIFLCVLSAIPDTNALKRAEQGPLKELALLKPCQTTRHNDLLHTANRIDANSLSKIRYCECSESRLFRLVLRGGSKDFETEIGPVSTVLERSRMAVRIGWSVMVCVFGVIVMAFVMYSYFWVAAQLVDLYAGQGKARVDISPHVIAAFAFLGSVAGSAGGGACIGYLARSSPCTHAAVVGAAFTLLQLSQVTLFTSADTPRCAGPVDKTSILAQRLRDADRAWAAPHGYAIAAH